MQIDDVYAEFIHTIRNCHKDFTLGNEPHAPIRSEAEFNDAFPDLRFVTTTAAGDEVELMPSGTCVKVTYANRGQYCDLVQEFRLHELDAHVAAIKRGIGHVVPLRTLSLLTWRELEVLVGGPATVDIELLKRHTTYDGYTVGDKTIKLFWKVFESFSDAERSMYVRFAWGRSRLPSGTARWTSEHKLSNRGKGDTKLPVSHTCFFHVELPDYTSEEKMRWGLSIAIHYGAGAIVFGFPLDFFFFFATCLVLCAVVACVPCSWHPVRMSVRKEALLSRWNLWCVCVVCVCVFFVVISKVLQNCCRCLRLIQLVRRADGGVFTPATTRCTPFDNCSMGLRVVVPFLRCGKAAGLFAAAPPVLRLWEGSMEGMGVTPGPLTRSATDGCAPSDATDSVWPSQERGGSVAVAESTGRGLCLRGLPAARGTAGASGSELEPRPQQGQ